MSKENRRWVSTNYGPENGVTVGPFSGLEVYTLAGSMIFGVLVLVLLTTKLNWPLPSSITLAGFCPTLIAFILLKLVVNRPVTYLKDALEWLVVRRRKDALLTKEPQDNWNEKQ